jgi:hypothetical protein
VSLISLGQAVPTFYHQGYPAVPVPVAQTYYIQDTQDVQEAKEDFMQAFQRALDGLLYELAPSPVKTEYIEDTQEVEEAKKEFFRIFNGALNGIIETAYLEDTPEVKEKKEEFFNTFESAMNNLLTTVENSYLEDTPEVKEAKARFNQAFADAKEGKVGAQYIEDTPEVKAAKAGFFRFFGFVLGGFLDTLSPKPGHNIIPEVIAPFYIKDDPDVAEEKRKLDRIYLDAVSELDETLKAIENVISNDKNNATVENNYEDGGVIEA